MLRKFLCVAALAMFAAPAHAGVYASSLFSVTDMRVQRASSEFGTYSNIGPGDLNLSFSSLTSVNTAILNGTTVQEDADAFIIPSVPLAQPAPDAAQAFITSGTETAPTENTFAITVPVPATSAFARGDTLTTGNLLAPGGLNLYSVSEIEAADSSLGEAIGSSTGTATFRFTADQAGWYQLQFDAALELLVSSIGPPAFRVASASASLSTNVNAGGPTDDQPNLVAGAISGTSYTGPLVFTDVTTAPIFLLPNRDYTLTIGQLTNASLAAVPEPGTMLAFAGILAAGGFSLRRRKK